MKLSVRVAAVLGAALAPLAVAAPATAAPPSPFTINENVVFADGGGTFTATGDLCPSGSFADDVHSFGRGGNSGGFNLLIRTVYTCDDGSGSFFAQKHVFITNTDDGQTNTGPIQLSGGTGSYARLSGHGTDVGFNDGGDTGTGLISGVLTRR